LLTGWLADRGRNGWITIWCAGLFGVLLVAFALSPWYPLSLGIIFFAGATSQIYMTVINTVLLVVVPEAYRGRVMGVYGMAWSLIPLGGAIAGPSAELWGAPLAVVLGGSLVTAMAAVVAMAMPRVRELE
jgi:MFS family permease